MESAGWGGGGGIEGGGVRRGKRAEVLDTCKNSSI
jgi:hypothetical protein